MIGHLESPEQHTRPADRHRRRIVHFQRIVQPHPNRTPHVRLPPTPVQTLHLSLQERTSHHPARRAAARSAVLPFGPDKGAGKARLERDRVGVEKEVTYAYVRHAVDDACDMLQLGFGGRRGESGWAVGGNEREERRTVEWERPYATYERVERRLFKTKTKQKIAIGQLSSCDAQ